MNEANEGDPEWSTAWLKRALLLVIVGLVVQLFTLNSITPASFLVFAGVGVGSVGVGLLMFGWAVLRARRTQGGGDDGG